MNNNIVSYALILSAFLPLAGCNRHEEKAAPSAEADAALRPLGGIFEPLNNCTATNVRQTYRMTIKDKIDFYNTTERFVVAMKDDSGTGETVGKPANRPKDQNYEGPTPLDFAIYSAEGEDVRVEIHLDDENINFMPAHNGKEMAVTAATGLGIQYLCGLTFSDEKRTASFIVRRPKGADVTQPMGFNIGFVIKQGNYVLPVHVDPNVKNDG